MGLWSGGRTAWRVWTRAARGCRWVLSSSARRQREVAARRDRRGWNQDDRCNRRLLSRSFRPSFGFFQAQAAGGRFLLGVCIMLNDNSHRYSRHTRFEPGDEIFGDYSRKQLLAMDER